MFVAKPQDAFDKTRPLGMPVGHSEFASAFADAWMESLAQSVLLLLLLHICKAVSCKRASGELALRA